MTLNHNKLNHNKRFLNDHFNRLDEHDENAPDYVIAYNDVIACAEHDRLHNFLCQNDIVLNDLNLPHAINAYALAVFASMIEPINNNA